MEPILTIDNLNSFGGNMLRQGDKSQLKYRLRDVGNKNLGISSKSCQVKMYGRNYTTIVYETTATVSSENTVSFTIDKVLPKGTFYLEFTVGDYIFPTDHREFFEITPSGKGIESNIIEIVGKDVLIQAVKSQVDTELRPLVTSLESAEQAEIQRATAESTRVSAEEQRKTDHANRSAELASKADKVAIENLVSLDTITSSADTIYHIENNEMVVTQFSKVQREIDTSLTDEPGYTYYASVEMKATDINNTLVFTGTSNLTPVYHSGSGEWETMSITSATISNPVGLPTIRFLASRRSGDFSDDPVRLRKLILINLTQTFGAGNEPTKEEMDELIKVTGYIDSENGVNVKEMLGYLMASKANKKQGDWITPTLLNGATSTSPELLQYRKNELGQIEIKGRVTVSSNAPFMLLPADYRPSTVKITTVKDNHPGTPNVGVLYITRSGICSIEYGNSGTFLINYIYAI